MCRIVRPPADGDRVVQRSADRAVDGQQGFVAGAVLQSLGLEVCNQLLIGDFCDLLVINLYSSIIVFEQSNKLGANTIIWHSIIQPEVQ